jgi:hypothetical protein
MEKSVEFNVYFLKAPEGEPQPSTEIDLFISTEKIMVLNTDLQVGIWPNGHPGNYWEFIEPNWPP